MPAGSTTALRPTLNQLAWLGIAFAVFGAAMFATKGIIIKLALVENIDALTTLTWRLIVAIPIFVAVGVIGYRRQMRGRPADAPPLVTPRMMLQALGVGMLGYYLASFLDFQALEYISAQFDRLILLTYPFFVVLFGAVFFKRKVTPVMMAGQALSYLGIALIFWRDLHFEGEHVVLGAALVFGSAIAYAGYQILAKPLIDRMGPQLFTSIAMSGAGPAVLIHFLLTHPVSDLAVPVDALPLMLAIGVVSTVIPAYSSSGAIGLIGPERTAVICNVSPIVTITLAVGILGEAFTAWHAVGTALVLVGAWVFARKAKPKAVEVEVAP